MPGMHFIRRAVQKECREKLIMLLYCSMNLTHVTPGELAFALPHAVNLAEMGQTLRDKQLGMMFTIPKS
jgi:AP-4 complex subunit epsilon-1